MIYKICNVLHNGCYHNILHVCLPLALKMCEVKKLYNLSYNSSVWHYYETDNLTFTA